MTLGHVLQNERRHRRWRMDCLAFSSLPSTTTPRFLCLTPGSRVGLEPRSGGKPVAVQPIVKFSSQAANLSNLRLLLNRLLLKYPTQQPMDHLCSGSRDFLKRYERQNTSRHTDGVG